MSFKPILRWAGSKRNALQYIQKYWDASNGRYIEPFCGSAALFFKVNPEDAILSDLNSNLVSFYGHCKTRHGVIWKSAHKMSFDKDTYNLAREEFNALPLSLKKSSLFFYLNRACFNGIYRTNKSGGFNVPFSGQKISKFPSYKGFRSASKQISKAKILNADFEEVILDNVKKKDFVFLDPPYVTTTKRTFAEYDRNSFQESDLKRLINCLNFIDSRGAKFVCTYDATELDKFEEVWQWHVDNFEVKRHVGGFQSTRKTAREVIFSNIRV